MKMKWQLNTRKQPRGGSSPIEVFYSYAHEDEALRNDLAKQLSMLKREGLISEWHDRQILPGDKWEQKIDDNLEAASLILLLVSPDFLASDYCYNIEMQRALERDKRGEAKVVPIILRPCEWQHAPFAHLAVLPKDGTAILTWPDKDTALLDVAQGLRRLLERTRPPVHSLPKEHMENRARVIKRVRTIWIDGLLAHSLQQGNWLDVALQEQPDALDNPWEELVQELQAPPRFLPAGTTISQAYDQADGRLLILGQAGGGKTLQLLILTRTLLERAEQDPYQPLPVVFVLSSWARKHRPLEEWLIEELKTRYRIPENIATHLIKKQQILPLLDGLDEVAPNAQEACMQAINAYIQTYLEPKNMPLVLSCRSDEYMRLSIRVNLQKAVSVLPLSTSQIEQYLQQEGQDVEALRQALRADSNLATMACIPLLLNIFVLTYRNSQLADLPLGLTQAEALPILFTNYTQRMLNRRGFLRSSDKKHALAWLTFLARQMHRYDQTVLSIETLQADDLNPRQRLIYAACYALQIGLLFFLAIGVPESLASMLDRLSQRSLFSDAFSIGINNGEILGLIIGVITALVAFLSVSPDAERTMFPTGFVLVSFLSAPIRTRVTSLIKRRGTNVWGIRPQESLTWNWSWKNIRDGLIWGFWAGPCLGALLVAPAVFIILCVAVILLSPLIAFWTPRLRAWRRGTLHIPLLDRLRNWPWRTLRPLLISLLIILVTLVDIVGPFIPGLTDAGLMMALNIGLPVWLIVSFFKIVSGSRVMQRTHFRPNEGIRRSGNNGLLVGLVVALSLILPIGIGSWFSFHTLISFSLFSFLIGISAGLSLGLYFGLSAFLKHVTLRFLLWQLDYLPWKIEHFLDEMIERLFLYRIGGSYIFIHRFLIDHFATLTPARQSSLLSASRDRQIMRVGLRRVFTFRRMGFLSVILCLLIISLIIVIPIHTASTITFERDATATAQAIAWQNFLEQAQYPPNFPGQGNIAIVGSSLQNNGSDQSPTIPSMCEPSNDGLHVFDTKPQMDSLCDYLPIFSNLAIRIDMTILKGNCGGIAFRFNITQSVGYVFYLCSNKTYGLAKYLSATKHVNLITATTLPTSLQRASELAVVALGSSISLFLNGQKLNTINDNQYITQSAVGLVAQDQQQTTEVLFHNLNIWSVTP
ncbi:MAG TPA: TIR domain-containing protein [Ktedonobacteraceae bacterium]|nr:TIR domain-containing protein [Ktedonobacteraceae bacterium]